MMKRYLILILVVACSAALVANDTIKQTDEYYLGLKVGMFNVTKTTMNQANMEMTSTTRTEVIKADSAEVTMKMTTKSRTVMKMKGMDIPPQETETDMETTYVIGKGIIKTKGFSLVNGQKIAVPEQTVDVSQNAMYGKVPTAMETKPYDQKVNTAAGSFDCALYENSGSKTWIAKDVPLGGIVKMETPQMTMELVEYGTGGGGAATDAPSCGGCESGCGK